jgi:hypothetical protein
MDPDPPIRTSVEQIRLRLLIQLFSSLPSRSHLKIIFFPKFSFPYYFWKLHLNIFLKIKSHEEVSKQWELRFFLLLLRKDRRFRSRSRIHISY